MNSTTQLRNLKLLPGTRTGERGLHDVFVLRHRHIYLLPTRYGLGYLLIFFTLLVMSILYNNNLAYAFCFLQGSLIVINLAHNYRNISGLIISSSQVDPVFMGEVASIRLIVTNPSPTTRYSIEISAVPLACETLIGTLPAGQSSIELSFRTNRRGLIECAPLTIASVYPFGFVKAFSIVNPELKLLVYPSPLSQRDATGNTGLFSPASGGIGAMDCFDTLREYRPGDPLNRIDWKASVRGQGLLSKVFTSEHGSDVWLDYAKTREQPVEQRLSELCSWVIDAANADLSYGMRLPNITLDISRGQQHKQRCLEALAMYPGHD